MISRVNHFFPDVIGKILIFLMVTAFSVQAQEINVSESSLSFGFLYSNQAAIKTVTITNPNEFSVLINHLRFQSEKPFRVSSPVNYNLYSGEALSIEVTALSFNEGVYTDTLLISFSAEGRQSLQKIPVDVIILRTSYDLQSTILIPSGSSNNEYRLVSVPGQAVPLYSYLKNFFGKSGPNIWRAFLWHSGWSECSSTSNFTTEDGFFLIHNTSRRYLRSDGIKPLMQMANTIILRKGWNIVRNGYLFPVEKKFVRLASGKHYQLYSYQGSWNLADRLFPWLGYAVYSDQIDTLIIEGYRSRYNVVQAVSENNMEGRIIVRSGSGVDSCLVVSFSDLQEPFRKPPALPGGIYSDFIKNGKEFGVISYSMIDDTPIHVHNPAEEKIQMEIILPEITDSLWCLKIPSGEYYYFRNRLMVEFKAKSGTNVCSLSRMKCNRDHEMTGNEIALSTHPNPFNSTLRINIQNENRDWLQIDILNILGQRIKTIYDGWINPGRAVFIWDGSDTGGTAAPSGMYFLSVKRSSGVLFRKVILLK